MLIYTSSTVISKIAAQSAESGKGWTFLLLYGAEIGVLGILRALLAAGHQTGGTVCGVCESGDGAFVVTFVGGITVRGADYGEKNSFGVGLVLGRDG